MSATPLTLLLVGPDQPGLTALLERLRSLGALVAHTEDPSRALQVLGTLLPDLLLAPSSPAELPRGVRWLPWEGELEQVPVLLAPHLPGLRSKQGKDRLRRLGELQIDEARGLVSLPPHQIHVPATELRLLLCLGRHGGRAVSRQQLLTEVWPAEQRPQPRSVDQVVRRLRQLLQGLGLAGRLRSLRGLGYRLDLDPLSPV